ncbi:hypothetical protein EOI86_07115 [Hwanghaeella grinnelliae]|uniref:Uncharacterized protein n=1 Tax=Hwanghaeella grinnelliae TaxID=2500179 RepID=A0A437QWV9_9PROT|nr:hypothetical protein [Hwanghaeella grinnelliae]RVU39020.1 hypothetical protein EOI86_07115 [Hwanghaeella grinnelliae]
MAVSDIALCGAALIRLGAEPITAFEEGTAEADIAGALYPIVRDGLLSAYPWSFATAQRALAQLSGVPVADFAFAYPLPPDFLRALSLGHGARGQTVPAGRGAEYRIHERRIHTNVEMPVLTYVFRPAESGFPPYFDKALTDKLSAEFCLPITENTARADLLQKLAGQSFQQAKTADAQGQSPGRIEDFALIDARG